MIGKAPQHSVQLNDDITVQRLVIIKLWSKEYQPVL
jgi:hypothetical protein